MSAGQTRLASRIEPSTDVTCLNFSLCWRGFGGHFYYSYYRRVPPPLHRDQAQIEMRQDETNGAVESSTLIAPIYDGVSTPTDSKSWTRAWVIHSTLHFEEVKIGRWKQDCIVAT